MITMMKVSTVCHNDRLEHDWKSWPLRASEIVVVA